MGIRLDDLLRAGSDTFEHEFDVEGYDEPFRVTFRYPPIKEALPFLATFEEKAIFGAELFERTAKSVSMVVVKADGGFYSEDEAAALLRMTGGLNSEIGLMAMNVVGGFLWGQEKDGTPKDGLEALGKTSEEMESAIADGVFSSGESKQDSP